MNTTIHDEINMPDDSHKLYRFQTHNKYTQFKIKTVLCSVFFKFKGIFVQVAKLFDKRRITTAPKNGQN